MITAKTTSLMIAILSSALLVGCSKGGFEAASTTSTSNNSGQSTTTPDEPTPTTPKEPTAYDKMDMNAFVASGSYENEQVISIDKANNALLLFLPMPPGLPFSGINIDVPQAKGVKLATVLDSQQKARVAVSIPLNLIIKGGVSLPAAGTLPGGRPLPMMPSGEFPSLALGLNQNSDNKIYMYFGVNAAGLFIESSYFPQFFGITAPIRNKAKTRTLGYFTIVPKQGVNNGGLFLSFILPNDLAKIIDDHLSGIIN
ncbi:hypothetical protein [Bdellovibrio reynosensis]|uniref:Lipoprotein n=1 Tax=Bdellovibrio reynosensis TaxID=2835041 RepID=A0ABY4CCC1_9BACT|nr:hypothetical protein [Bdellovibrio reynosensis]UOF01168.1 hypothetical protein MNR06_15825 [Bdellovibrio reynosensis]